MTDEIGSCNAVIHKIQTTLDGGARITLDIGAEATIVITKLLQNKLSGQELITIGMVSNGTT